MELAFLDTAPSALTTAGEQAEPAAFGAAGQRSLLRDVHCCMLRLLEVTTLRAAGSGLSTQAETHMRLQKDRSSRKSTSVCLRMF